GLAVVVSALCADFEPQARRYSKLERCTWWWCLALIYGLLLSGCLGQSFLERRIAWKQLGAGLPGCQGIIILTELLVLVAQQHVGHRELGLRRLRFLLIDQ